MGAKEAEQYLKLEMRIAALEYLYCGTTISWLKEVGFTEDQFERYFEGLRTRAREQMFPGLDPALSDMFSAEWQQAVERLLDYQKTLVTAMGEPKGG